MPYAREHSAIKIFGDAYTWWDKAAGKLCARRGAGKRIAVMVLNGLCRRGPRPCRGGADAWSASREIRVDHANWLDDGSIYVNDPVEDVSAANDWSSGAGLEHQDRRLGQP